MQGICNSNLLALSFAFNLMNHLESPNSQSPLLSGVVAAPEVVFKIADDPGAFVTRSWQG